jgi:flavin-dependent dehydrogenase
MFRLTAETLKQLRTVYKASEDLDIEFAASFFIVELEEHIIAYLDIIKTKEELQGQRKGTNFIGDLVKFIEQLLVETAERKGAFIIAGQSQFLKPHEFFTK